jgi:hypothetical protein
VGGDELGDGHSEMRGDHVEVRAVIADLDLDLSTHWLGRHGRDLRERIGQERAGAPQGRIGSSRQHGARRGRDQ